MSTVKTKKSEKVAQKAVVPSAPARPLAPKTSAEAFERILPLVEKVDPGNVRTINLDVPMAASIVLGASERISELLPEVERQLPTFDKANILMLNDLALGTWYAHLVWVAQNRRDTTAFDTLIEEATELRRALLADAEALAYRGLVDEQRVAEIREGRGHLDTANDLVALSSLFGEAWVRVEGRTAATRTEIERAAELGVQLIISIGRRSDTGPDFSPGGLDPADVRLRAYTLLRAAYDECLRAVTYLRWSFEDAQLVVPPMRRFVRRRPPTEEDGGEDGDEDSDDPVDPVDPDEPAGEDGDEDDSTDGDDEDVA